MLLNSSCANFPYFLTIPEERSRVCDCWCVQRGFWEASCPRRGAKTAIPGAVPVVFRGRFLVTQIILDDSEATFSLCQIRFSVRCVVYNHNKTTASANKCCRKVKPSVNSSGNKSSILHILQMESSRPDGTKASLLPIFIWVGADIFFI